MRLFHFSESGDIDRFVPRPLLQPPRRAPGMEWLNDPLVWTIAEETQYLYLFPRDCPRIVMWPTVETTDEDRSAWLGDLPREMVAVAYVETQWLQRLERTTVFRYELPGDTFLDLHDAGMHVSRSAVVPSDVTRISDLRAELFATHVQVKAVASLLPLKAAWQSSVHVSGIRLRNAVGWQ